MAGIFVSKDGQSWIQLPPSTDDKNKILKETMSVLWDKMFRMVYRRDAGIELLNIYGVDVCPVYLLEAQEKEIHTFQTPVMCHFDRSDNLSSKPERILQIVETLTDTIETFAEKGIFELYKILLFRFMARQGNLSITKNNI